MRAKGLPAPVWTIFGALRKALKPETSRELTGVPSVRVRGAFGPLAHPSRRPGPSHDLTAGTARRWSS